MSMIVENSVCVNCDWKGSCQKINKLREMCSDGVSDSGRPKDTFNVVVTRCSLKNLDRSYDNGKNRGGNRDKNRSRNFHSCSGYFRIHFQHIRTTGEAIIQSDSGDRN